jgi:hypothetical protein
MFPLNTNYLQSEHELDQRIKESLSNDRSVVSNDLDDLYRSACIAVVDCFRKVPHFHTQTLETAL